MLLVPALVALHSPELPSGASQLAAPASPPAVSPTAPPKRGQWGRKSPGRPHFTKGMIVEVNVKVPKKKAKQEKQKPVQPDLVYPSRFLCRTSDNRPFAGTRRPLSTVGQAYSINAAAYCSQYDRAAPSIADERAWPSPVSFWQCRTERPQSPPHSPLAGTLKPDLAPPPRYSLDQYNFRQELARQRRARYGEGQVLAPEQRQNHGAEAMYRRDGGGDVYSPGQRLSVSAHAHARIHRNF